ncbi:unnamed protein product [Calypogeia fissa]
MATVMPSSANAVAVFAAAGSREVLHTNASFAPRFACPGGGRSGFSLRQSRESLATRMPRIICQASEKEKLQGARKNQLQATEVFAELLKAGDVRAAAQEHVTDLTEDFFLIASTYLDLAKKEGNVEVVTKLESTLQIAMSVKEATLRPEIRLLNQLLRQKDAKELSNIIQSNLQYLQPDSYFFQILKRMIADVEKQTQNPNRLKLLAQLRYISKETNEVKSATKKSKGFGSG